MSLRSLRERAIQTIAFELGGILIATPLYVLTFSAPLDGTLALIASLALAVMLWSPLHNTAFDIIDLHLNDRVASDRPHALRILHAVSHEVTSLVVTVPLLMILGGHSLLNAVAVDFGLTALFAVYAYFFNILYDRLRPVRPWRQEN